MYLLRNITAMRKISLLLFVFTLYLTSCKEPKIESKYAVNISFDSSQDTVFKDGRLLLMLSTDDSKEPRFQINDGLNTQLIFGMNVENWEPNTPITFNESVFGYPYQSLAEVPPGEYNVQALLNVYETFNLSTGHTVKLPMDNGEGQQWNRSPGNLYSKPFKIRIATNGIENVDVVLDLSLIHISEPTRPY